MLTIVGIVRVALIVIPRIRIPIGHRIARISNLVKYAFVKVCTMNQSN